MRWAVDDTLQADDQDVGLAGIEASPAADRDTVRPVPRHASLATSQFRGCGGGVPGQGTADGAELAVPVGHGVGRPPCAARAASFEHEPAADQFEPIASFRSCLPPCANDDRSGITESDGTGRSVRVRAIRAGKVWSKSPGPACSTTRSPRRAAHRLHQPPVGPNGRDQDAGPGCRAEQHGLHLEDRHGVGADKGDAPTAGPGGPAPASVASLGSEYPEARPRLRRGQGPCARRAR